MATLSMDKSLRNLLKAEKALRETPEWVACKEACKVEDLIKALTQTSEWKAYDEARAAYFAQPNNIMKEENGENNEE